jgi:NADH-quinone oxidoreductase subunit N
MTLCLLSLAGIPPLAGFAGKVFLLVEAIDGAMAWLAILALVNFTVALYYYVRLVAEMYLRHPRAEASLPAGRLGRGLSYAIIAAGVLVLGILPGPPLAAIAAVARLLS